MKNKIKELLSFIMNIAIGIAIGLFIVIFVGQHTYIEGHSMEPSLQHHDVLIIDKVSYRFTEPSRFDIIAFPYDAQDHHVKRIIGLPGEEVQIIAGFIYINGVLLEEDFGYEELINNPGIARERILLGEDEYFLLGDNRNRSRDSRDPTVGARHRDEFVGRVWVRVWPPSNFGFLD